MPAPSTVSVVPGDVDGKLAGSRETLFNLLRISSISALPAHALVDPGGDVAAGVAQTGTVTSASLMRFGPPRRDDLIMHAAG